MTFSSSTYPDSSPRDRVDSVFSEELASIGEGLKRLNSPRRPRGLSTYAWSVRRLLSVSESTSWLLEPVDAVSDPIRALASKRCASLIKSKIPSKIFRRPAWPPWTNALLDDLQIYASTLGLRLATVTRYPPLRLDSETLIQYLDRLELWAARYCPSAFDSPQSAQRVADIAWKAHSLYDCRLIWLSFEAIRTHFRSWDDVFFWFMRHSSLYESMSPRLAVHSGPGLPLASGAKRRASFSSSDEESQSQHCSTKKKRRRSGPGTADRGPSEDPSLKDSMFPCINLPGGLNPGGWLMSTAVPFTCTPRLSDLQHAQPVQDEYCTDILGKPTRVTHKGVIVFTFPSCGSDGQTLSVSVRAVCIPSWKQPVFAENTLLTMGLAYTYSSEGFFAYFKNCPETCFEVPSWRSAGLKYIGRDRANLVKARSSTYFGILGR